MMIGLWLSIHNAVSHMSSPGARENMQFPNRIGPAVTLNEIKRGENDQNISPSVHNHQYKVLTNESGHNPI